MMLDSTTIPSWKSCRYTPCTKAPDQTDDAPEAKPSGARGRGLAIQNLYWQGAQRGYDNSRMMRSILAS